MQRIQVAQMMSVKVVDMVGIEVIVVKMRGLCLTTHQQESQCKGLKIFRLPINIFGQKNFAVLTHVSCHILLGGFEVRFLWGSSFSIDVLDLLVRLLMSLHCQIQLIFIAN